MWDGGPLSAGAEVWNINVRPDKRVLKRLTRSLQIHPDDGRCAAEDAWLAECPVPIYVCGPEDAKLNTQARVYPWRLVPRTAPISSSFDAVMALALLEGFTSIYVAGADLQVGTLRERLVEHVSLAFWLGVAAGMGVRVTLEPGARLLKHPHRYGRDYWSERKWAQRLATQALKSPWLDDGAAKVNTTIKGVRFSGRRDGR